MSLGQQPQHHQQIHHGEARGDPYGHRDVDPRQLSTDKWTDDETEAEGHPNQTEGFGTFLSWRDVCEHSPGCRGGSAT